jgi:hypothetical protein
MILPQVVLQLDSPRRMYQPLDVLSGQFHLEGVAGAEVQAIELSVLWHTEGKGDEDMSVHFFQRYDSGAGDWDDFRQPHPFSTVLPNSPLSYHGLILRIHWCVRVRTFLARGKELSSEAAFQLGAVPQAEPLAT